MGATMSSLFERFKGKREPTSAEIAKERLKLVLVTDRSDLSPDKLEEMQREIIDVIRRYIPIDDADVLIKLEQRDRKNYLVADIPLYRDHTYQATPESGDEAALMTSLAASPVAPDPSEAKAAADPKSADPDSAEPDADETKSADAKSDAESEDS
jgi:cell division topological specificity factor